MLLDIERAWVESPFIPESPETSRRKSICHEFTEWKHDDLDNEGIQGPCSRCQDTINFVSLDITWDQLTSQCHHLVDTSYEDNKNDAEKPTKSNMSVKEYLGTEGLHLHSKGIHRHGRVIDIRDRCANLGIR